MQRLGLLATPADWESHYDTLILLGWYGSESD